MWFLCEPSSLGSKLPSQTNSWQCLMRASQVENGLLSIILQTWHDLDLSQLWRQGCHKSKYLTHQTQNLKNLWAEKNSDIFNISLVCCRGFSHLLSQQTFCANTIWRNFHSNLFQSPPNAQLTKSLVSMLGRRTWIKYCTDCKCCPVSLLIVRSQ